MSDSLREKLEKELDKLPWKELARHHAFGKLLLVKAPVDLLDAAIAVANDDTANVKSWMEQQLIGPPSDEEIKSFAESNEREFLVSIISPFILVQEQQN